MRNDPRGIAFTPVTEADLPLLREWLRQPHVMEWWGDPDEELEQIRSTFDGVDGTEAFLVHAGGEPVGYIQSWKPAWYAADPRWIEEAPWLAGVPAGTLGLDVFIGRPDLIRRGLGTAIVRAFARKLFAAGAPRLMIDPDAANGRAVRAYEKAGFRRYAVHEGEDETTLLMELFPDDIEEEA